MVKMFFQITCPYSDDRIAASAHVGILRLVKLYALLLSAVQFGILRWVSVPVVTIKLNDEPERWNEGINAKLFADQVLTLIRNIKTVQQGVSDRLDTIGIQALLFRNHRHEHRVPVGVGISTWLRAVGHVVFPRLGARGRPCEDRSAHLASMRGFISAAPLIGMFFAAKEIGLSCGKSGLNNPNGRPAYLALTILPLLALWLWGGSVAIKRAEFLVWPQSSCNDCPAMTGDGSYLVKRFTHVFIIAQLTATVNVIEAMRYV